MILVLATIFLTMTLKAQATKTKIDEQNNVTVKNFHTAKGTISKMKR